MIKQSMPTLVSHFLLLLALSWTRSTTAAETQIVVDTQNPKWTISRHLVGLHQVYTCAPDAAYADGSFAEWVRRAGIGTSRYPGGTIVKYWDWKNPTGVMNGDPWDPKWDPQQNTAVAQWMSLDEYLTFVEQSGITPLLGVNALSGYQHGRQEESIKRAAEMVAYVKGKGYGGAFWYIGNEEENKYEAGVIGYAKVFRAHAMAMKRVDPDIKIFWNANHVSAQKIKTFLKYDGGTSNGLESHGKWPYGGDPKGYEPGTFDQWLKEAPLRDRKNYNRAWRLAADTYREAAAQAGRRNYLIANNEYGIGKDQNIQGFNRYSYGLLMTDMLQEHFLGNWDMTCFWDTKRGDENGLMSANQNYRLNPFHLGMELLADAQGGKMLKATSDSKSVYGFASAQEGRTLLYLINKTRETRTLRISFMGKPSLERASGRVMQDTKDHWGEIADLPLRGKAPFEATMPPLSFCQITFKHSAQQAPAEDRPRPAPEE